MDNQDNQSEQSSVPSNTRDIAGIKVLTKIAAIILLLVSTLSGFAIISGLTVLKSSNSLEFHWHHIFAISHPDCEVNQNRAHVVYPSSNLILLDIMCIISKDKSIELLV